MIVLTSDCDTASTAADIAPDTQHSHLTRPIITQSYKQRRNVTVLTSDCDTVSNS